MFIQSTFEENINPYTLKFNDPELEAEFIASRIKFKRLPLISRKLLLGICIFTVVMFIGEVIRVTGENNSQKLFLRVAAFICVLIGCLIEISAYCWEKIAIIRSIPSNVILTTFVVLMSFNDYSGKINYPVLDVWSVPVFVAIFIIQGSLAMNWLICVISQAISTTITIIIFFVFYSDTLLYREGTYSFVFMSVAYVVYMVLAGLTSCFFFYISETSEKKTIFDEVQITHAKEGYKKFLNTLPEPILVTSSGVIKMWNNALLNLVNAPLGTQIFDPSYLRTFTRTNSDNTLEEDIMKTDSQRSKCEISEYQFRNNGINHKLTVKSVEISHDKERLSEYIIEDHTALEELEKARAEKKCFYILLSTAAHDFRTPLNGLSGLLDIISPQLISLPCFEELQLAKNCIHRMLLYLQGLSFLNNIVTGDLHINSDEISIKGIVRETINLLDYSAKAKGIKIEEQFCNIPEIVILDKEKYQQIFVNLLENSIKYTFKGGIKIRVNYISQNSTLETTIEDSGVGIDQENQKEVFKLFRKTYKTQALNPQGIGIGLYLAKKLSKRLGGGIKLISEKDKGTTMIFTIKVHLYGLSILNTNEICIQEHLSTSNIFHTEEMEEFTNVISIPAIAPTMPTPHRLLRVPCKCTKVLIVDDEPLNVYVLQSYLKSVGIPADTAMNGEHALAKISEKQCAKCKASYEIILMDINMPIMDGIACTKAIQKLIKEGKMQNAHIFAVTAAAHLENDSIFSQYQTIGFTEICIFYFLE